MPHDQHEHDGFHAIARELARMVEALRDATTTQGLQFKWMVQLHHLATKADLEAQVDRILSAIEKQSPSDISTEDKAALAALLQRSERFTAKLEALDKQTP